MHSCGDISQCCEYNQKRKVVEWHKVDSWTGPEGDGWTICLYGWDVYFESINYCPFCGIKLEKMEK